MSNNSMGHGAWSGGKGSAYRRGVDQKKFAEGWDKIFGNNKGDNSADSDSEPSGNRGSDSPSQPKRTRTKQDEGPA